MGVFQSSFSGLVRSREGSPFMPEQGRFNESFRNRRAMDRHKRLIGAAHWRGESIAPPTPYPFHFRPRIRTVAEEFETR